MLFQVVSTTSSSQFELDSIWRFICLIFHFQKMLCQLYLNIIPSFFYGTFCIIFYFIDPIRPCEVLWVSVSQFSFCSLGIKKGFLLNVCLIVVMYCIFIKFQRNV